MTVLILFAFIAGIVTVLSPCILPVLPIILSSSLGTDEKNRSRPYGVVFGFILSFTFFTLFLSALVKVTGISSQLLRNISIVLIALFGVSLITPKFQVWMEGVFSKLSKFSPKSKKDGFGGGMLVGFSLGLLWTPCVGPILASVISVAIIGEVSLAAVFITLAYSLGTAIPMILIIKGGNAALKKVPWLVRNTDKIQKIFGVLMIATAVMIAFEADRQIQIYLLDKFPKWGVGLTQIEDKEIVTKELEKLRNEGEELVYDRGQPSQLYSKKGKAPELIQGGTWINSKPLTLEELKGKVVLIDFWTYTCINCQRTFPYLREWWTKYEDKGLVIIGVHAPEFEFEKKYENVLNASQDFDLKYPIMQDNDFKTWRSYKNRYWPAKYLIDKDGDIRYTHFGEGAYDETEKVIQLLLNEIGVTTDVDVSNPEYKNYSRTPETYLGHLRMAGFSSPEKIVKNQFSTYSMPSKLPNNSFSYEGEWFVSGEYSNPKAGSKLQLNFESKNVFLVMNPKTESSTVKVFLDGEFVKEVVVDSDYLYTLIELNNPGRHILTLEFLDDNTEIFAFTFG